MNNPIGWFEIYVQDMQRAKEFYQAVFDVTLSPLSSPDLDIWAFPMDQTSYGASGALVKMPGMQPSGTGVLVYFRCDDCAVQAQRAVQAGGTLQRAKISIGQYGHMALVVDTEGNLIGLHSMN